VRWSGLRSNNEAATSPWRHPAARHAATPSTKNLLKHVLKDAHAVLRRAIQHAQRRNKVLRNVAELVDIPEGRPGRPSKAMPLEQAQAVIEASKKTRLHAYFVLSLLTGVRTEEARALTWDRVHLEKEGNLPPHVEVWRSVRKGGDTKTKKSRRTLALPEEVVRVLVAHQGKQ
jgi:integrase